MGRDLFAEAGIVPDSAVEGRDLFAEAGLVPDAPPAKRPIGALEAFGRSMGDSIAAVPDFLNEAAAALLRPVDGVIGTDIAGALTRPTGPVKQARTAYKLNQQTEQLDGTGAQLAHGVGPLPRDIIAAIMTSGLSAAPAATLPIVDTGRVAAMKALVPELQQGAKAMMVPGALSSRDAYNEARVAGADPMQAAALGTVRGVGTVAQGALPMAKAGNMATRVASGVPLAVLPNRVQLQAENLVAPESMQHQPTLTDDASAAIPGMLLAALLGPRAGRIQTPAEISNIRRTDNMNKWGIDRTDGYGPELAPVEPSAPRAPEPYAADPYAVNPKQATADLNEKLFPAPDESPDLKLVPKVGDGALFSTKSNPDPASIPSRLTLEGDGPNRILADSDVRNIEKVLGMSEAEVTALPRPAQEALRDHANSFAESKQSFDLADRRQRQADADLANNGQIDPDYQGGGAAARFGKFNQGARPVTLLDGVQDVTRFASKDGIATVEYTDEQGTTHRLQVEESRLRDVVISANQRMDTQDFNARSSEPPSAVGRGTMASENMPRRSTDRIAGDQYGGRATPYNPNPLDGGRVSGDVLPPDAGTDVVPGARREGDTVNGETLRPFDAPNEQRQIGAPPRQIGERSRFATDEQGRTVDRENRQPMASEGRPLARQQTEQTTNDKRTNEPTNEQIQKATEAVKAEAQGQEQPAADVGITASEKLDQIQARMASRQTPNEAARAINEKAVAPAAESSLSVKDTGTPDDVETPKPVTAAEWANEMARLREEKPRPLDKLYGKNGPTAEQAADHAEKTKQFNAAYRKASAEQKNALERDNAEARNKQPAPPDSGTVKADSPAPDEPVNGYAKDQAEKLASSMSKKGLPSESYPHPSGDGTFAIRAAEAPAPKQTPDPDTANPERNLFDQPAQDAKQGNDPVDKLFGPDGAYSGNTNMHDISSAVGEALTRLSKGTFGESKKWYDNLVENMRPLFAGGLNGKVEKPTGTKITIAQAISRAWPARIVQKLAGSIEGRMRMLAGDDLANMFYSEAGKGKAVGETFEQSSRHNALSALNRAMRAIDSVVPNAEKEFTRLRATGMGRAEARKASSNAADYAMRNLEARLRSNRFDSTALGKAAKEVAVVLKDWGDYLIRHGALAEGQLVKDGFLPRVMDTQKILYSKGNSEQAFRKDLDAALRREGIANPKEVVDEWIANLASNQFGVRHEGEKTDFILSDATAMPNSLKSRKLSKAFEKTMQEKGWYVSDLPTVLSRYFAATARKAEFMRLMGKDMEQWAGIKKKMTDEGNAKHIREVIQLIKSATGMGGDGHPTSVDGVTLAAGTRAFTALSAMERVTLSSVNDPVQAAVTSGRPQDMAKLAKDVVQILANSSDKAEAMRFAENLGLASKAHDDHIALSRLGMDTDGSAQTTKAEWMDSLTGRFMRSIGMPQLQYASRVAATDYGRIIVRDWLASAVSGKGLSQKNAIFNLKDMGIPESRIKEVHALVEQAVNGKVTWEQISKGGAAGELMTTAIRRFATRSVIEVTKSEKPKWAVSSPTGKMVYALQSFAAGYAKNVLDRFQNVAFNSELNAAQKATLLAGPAVGMAGIALLQSLMWELRDLIFGTTAVEPKTVGQKAMRAVSAAGVFGRADTLMQAFTGTRYGRDLSSMGVGYVGQVGTRALETTYRFIDPEAKALNAMGEKSGRPLNSPNNNTADRAFVGMLHDIFVEPVAHGMIALAAPTAGVSVPVAMGAQMMIGSPMVKESMVSAVAGEKKQHKQQQRQW